MGENIGTRIGVAPTEVALILRRAKFFTQINIFSKGRSAKYECTDKNKF
jgi:hypothetical protein